MLHPQRWHFRVLSRIHCWKCNIFIEKWLTVRPEFERNTRALSPLSPKCYCCAAIRWCKEDSNEKTFLCEVLLFMAGCWVLMLLIFLTQGQPCPSWLLFSNHDSTMTLYNVPVKLQQQKVQHCIHNVQCHTPSEGRVISKQQHCGVNFVFLSSATYRSITFYIAISYLQTMKHSKKVGRPYTDITGT